VKAKFGDFNEWVTMDFHRNIERIVNAKAGRTKPYFILVIIKNGYDGTPAYGNANMLIADETQKLVAKIDTQVTTTDMNLEGKRVMSMRMVILEPEKVPPVPMIGTSLWKVDNVKGDIRCIYILPQDKPIIEGVELEQESQLVFRSGKGMPLRWNEVN